MPSAAISVDKPSSSTDPELSNMVNNNVEVEVGDPVNQDINNDSQKNSKSQNLTPIQQILLIIEHKIRNLEKRKVNFHFMHAFIRKLPAKSFLVPFFSITRKNKNGFSIQSFSYQALDSMRKCKIKKIKTCG